MLGQLTERERRVLQLRFGLGDGRSRTLEEVGREFGVTRERIRQIESKALQAPAPPLAQQEAEGLSGVGVARLGVGDGVTNPQPLEKWY